LLDTARLWAAGQQARVFHLGGGVGARTDSLFQFKAGFSPQRHEFLTWRWILEPERYRAVCEERERSDESSGLELASADYFPEYRAPARLRFPELLSADSSLIAQHA
jgi:hypothetical protein